MKIRRKVLNMTHDQWIKSDRYFMVENSKKDDAVLETTPKEFLENVGLPGALSVYCNEAEKLFFKEIYDLERQGRI